MRRGLFVLVATVVVGCSGNGTAGRTFDQELQLTLRAGRGELTELEKKQLLKENHPILAQVGNPQAFKLVELFSRLPEAERRHLLEDSYVKWRIVEFDAQTQELHREVIELIFRSQTGGRPLFETVADADSRKALLEGAEVGFAVVDLGESKQKVVSWFAFGPKLAIPLWVTIVNSDAAGTEEYVRAHLRRLPLLRSMKHTRVPRLYVQPLDNTSMV